VVGQELKNQIYGYTCGASSRGEEAGSCGREWVAVLSRCWTLRQWWRRPDETGPRFLGNSFILVLRCQVR
jgi:hypothetical protein